MQSDSFRLLFFRLLASHHLPKNVICPSTTTADRSEFSPQNYVSFCWHLDQGGSDNYEEWVGSFLQEGDTCSPLENPESQVFLLKWRSEIALMTHCMVSHCPGCTGELGTTIPHCPALQVAQHPTASQHQHHIQPETHCQEPLGPWGAASSLKQGRKLPSKLLTQ